MSPQARQSDSIEPPRRRPGRPRLTEPSPEYQQRLEDIIETGIRVFHDRGYDSGSLDDVATAMGLSKASLYHYLRSKAQLLYFIFDRAITLALQRLDQLSDLEDPRQELTTLIAHQVRMVSDEPSLFAVFFDQRPRLDDAFEAEIRQKERRYVARIAAVVTRAAAAGELPDVDARHAAHAILGMTSWVYKWFDPTRDDADEVARTMTRMILGDTAAH